MPKLLNPTLDYKCFLCKSQANFISFNSKKYRCVEQITKCPGFILKAETARCQNISTADRIEHMKLMSKNGNARLRELHKDEKWRSTKGKNITFGKVNNGSAIDPSIKTEWQQYADCVDRITRTSWKYYENKINPTRLIRGKEFELDHKYSKKEGFLNNVPPEIVGHYYNLALIEKSQNRKKYSNSSISLTELYSGINSTTPSDSPSSETTTS